MGSYVYATRCAKHAWKQARNEPVRPSSGNRWGPFACLDLIPTGGTTMAKLDNFAPRPSREERGEKYTGHTHAILDDGSSLYVKGCPGCEHNADESDRQRLLAAQRRVRTSSRKESS
jgi:hypothetical protein